MTAARPARRTRASAGLLAVLVAVLAVVWPPSAAAALSSDGPVVLLGVGGLRWSDVDPVRTPALWSLADAASLGTLSVRTVRPVTCPADGWLTVGAGRRAELVAPDGTGLPCAPAPVVTATSGGGAEVAGWAGVLAHQAELPYDAHPGLLARALAGRCATAVGPTAALALAGPDGTVPRWRPDATGLDAAAWSACDVWLVDLGTVITPGAALGVYSRLLSRQEQVAAVDARLAALLPTLPANADVLLAGLSDSSTTPHLTVLAERRPGAAPGLLGSDSTRQPGLAQLTDLTPTVLARAGAPAPAELVGSPLQRGPGRGTTAHAVARLADLDRAGQGLRAVTAITYLIAVAALLAVAARFALALRRDRPARHWRGTAVAALAVAALPGAGFLAGTAPWWRAAPPLLALVPLLLLWAAALTLLALAGPWRRRPAGPAAAVAVLTALVLAVDVATGARLALVSPLGFSLLEAGRFYGVGNVAFALLITCGLLAVGVLVGPLLRAGRRVPAA
ncbi:MAG TPA: hypothetical protein VFS29_06615, partial [Motilibacteraceae bacterium]|nr:hypothetical protein [Motilibacteraceae bacterium]